MPTIKDQLTKAVEQLNQYTDDPKKKRRLSRISMALYQASIPENNPLQIAAFIFILFSTMPDLVKQSEALKILLHDCGRAMKSSPSQRQGHL